MNKTRRKYRYGVTLLAVAALLFLFSEGGGSTYSAPTVLTPSGHFVWYAHLLIWQSISITIQPKLLWEGVMNYSLYVVDEENFVRWQNGGEFFAQVKLKDFNGTFSFVAPRDGVYHVIVENHASNGLYFNPFVLRSGGLDYIIVGAASLSSFFVAVFFFLGWKRGEGFEVHGGEPLRVGILPLPANSAKNKLLKRFSVMVRMEFRRFTSFPTGTILLIIGLYNLIGEYRAYRQLGEGLYDIYLLYGFWGTFSILGSMLVALSIAGDLEKGVTATFLIQPFRRLEIISSKFITILLTVFSVGILSPLFGFLLVTLRKPITIPAIQYVAVLPIGLLLIFLFLSISTLISVATNRALPAALITFMLFMAWNAVPLWGYGGRSLTEVPRIILLLQPQKAITAIYGVMLNLYDPHTIFDATPPEAAFALMWMVLVSITSLSIALLIFKKRQF